MLLFVASLLILSSFLFPKSKILTFVWLAYYWMLFAFNTRNADYDAYQSIYWHINVGEEKLTTVTEEGYILLARFSSQVLSLSYQQFLVLVSTICIVLLSIVLHEYSKLPNGVLSLFLIYPYWVMICQYRSYLSFLLVLIGIACLYKLEGRTSYIAFFLFIILGSLFHRSALLYSYFFVAKKMSIRHLVVTSLLISLSLWAMISSGVLMRLANGLVSERKAIQWLSSESNRSLVGIWLLLTARALLLYIEYWLLTKIRASSSYDAAYYDFLFKISVLATCFLILEVNDQNYERLFRPELFIYYCFIIDYLHWHFNINHMSIGSIPVAHVVAVLFVFV